MLFWILATGLALAVASLIALAGTRARGPVRSGPAADVAVYRAQLDEADRDRVRGVLSADDAARLKTEIARRLLAADAAGRDAAGPAPWNRGRVPLIALCGLVVVGAVLMYSVLGAPGYGDMPRADRLDRARELRESRPTQAAAEAAASDRPAPPVPDDYAALMEQLRTAVATRPDDLRGLRLLARNEAALGNFRAAYAAQAQVLDRAGDLAAPTDFSDYGEMLVMAAGGFVSHRAEAAFRTALARDPDNGPSQYYIGVLMRQTGRPDIAFRLWDRLLRTGPEDAPWIAPIRAQIDEAAMLAGVSYRQPAQVAPGPAAPALPGPDAAAVAAAGQMSADDRAAMIRNMVAGLSDRLARQGGSAAEWARLVSAYGVLGETAQAQAIYDEARQLFTGRDGDLQQIEAAGRRAGLAE